jgi:hypothetical protein
MSGNGGPLAVDVLMALARHIDFCASCVTLAMEFALLAERGHEMPVVGPIDWQRPADRVLLVAMHREPGGCLLH